jgi:DNA-binding NtrC family response regulator
MGIRVLVVEDERDFAATFAEVCEEYAKVTLGHKVEVLIADTYEMALSLVRKGVEQKAPIGVVIADLWLPTVSGEKLPPKIHAESPTTRVGLWSARGRDFVTNLIRAEGLTKVTALEKTDLQGAAAFVQSDEVYRLWLENKKELGG